jgi:hypothetical protein
MAPDIQSIGVVAQVLGGRRKADSLTVEEAGVLVDDWFDGKNLITDLNAAMTMIGTRHPDWGFSTSHTPGEGSCSAAIMLPSEPPKNAITDPASWASKTTGSAPKDQPARALIAAYLDALIYLHCLTEPVSTEEWAWVDSELKQHRASYEQMSQMFDHVMRHEEEAPDEPILKQIMRELVERRRMAI